MTKGILLFSFNTPSVQYDLISNICATLIKYFLNIPVTVVTDTKGKLESSLYDNIIIVKDSSDSNVRWRNTDRSNYYELSPYNNTLVIDSDYLIFNDSFLKFFETEYDLLLSNKAIQTSGQDVHDSELRISNVSIDMTWATLFYFQKGLVSKSFLELTDLIRSNYPLYCKQFSINSKVYRNDYVFSIARHLLSDRAQNLIPLNPFPIYTAYQNVYIEDINKDGLTLIDPSSDSKILNIRGLSVHVLNKATILDNYDKFIQTFQ